jgi:hypothetical protein
MRQWLYLLIPVAILLYAIVYPRDVIRLATWIGEFFH